MKNNNTPKKTVLSMKRNNEDIAIMKTDIQYIKEELQEIKKALLQFQEKADKDFVTQKEFEPYKKAVIFAIVLLCGGVLGALIKTVLLG